MVDQLRMRCFEIFTYDHMLDTGCSDFLLLCTNYRLRQVHFGDKPMYESGISRYIRLLSQPIGKQLLT